MTILVTLSEAGNDTGPFNLYTNMDGFVVPFELGVPKALLVAGYSTALAPDNASIVRVQSTGGCVDFVDITLVDINTTTTSSTTLTTTTTQWFYADVCYKYFAFGQVHSPGTITYTDCNDVEQTVTVGGPNDSEELEFCARLNSAVWSGSIVVMNQGVGTCS
jgi:hypothetical protein